MKNEKKKDTGFYIYSKDDQPTRQQIIDYIDIQIKGLKDLPKLPQVNDKIGIKWLEIEDKVYLATKEHFNGDDKEWADGEYYWVYWMVCDKIEELINKLR
jgi:hypothetical protein